MEIVTLIENDVSPDASELHSEAGLSLYIKSANRNILFDTGSSGRFAENAEKLGVDISRIDLVVISHAHFDHTGGLKRFFEINDKARVYIKKQAIGDYFYKVLFINKNIGTNPSLFQKYNDRFVFVEDDLEIEKGIRILTHIQKNHPLPLDSRHIMKLENGKLVHDDFLHEQMLLITENNHLYCFTGCSHHGIVNMVETAVQQAGTMKMSVIGGFHMYNPVTKGLSENKETVIKVGQLLKSYQFIDKIATGHCTGKRAYDILKTELSDQLVNLHTGSVIRL